MYKSFKPMSPIQMWFIISFQVYVPANDFIYQIK